MFKRNKKNRKKGSIIIEQLLILPIMIGIIWLIMQMIMFVYSNTQVNNAANETAQVVSQMMRGTDQQINEIDPGKRDLMEGEALKKILNAVETNSFIMLGKDNITEDVYMEEVNGQITLYTGGDPNKEVRLVIEDQVLCESSLKNDDQKRVICMYTEEDDSLGKKEQQIVVRIKAPFHLIGSIIPFIDDQISLYGNGVSTKELAGRFQYYD